MKKRNVALFGRHAVYSQISAHKKRPPYFSRENCYHNLLQTAPKNLAITFVLDTHFGSLESHFLSQEAKHKVITFDGGSESSSFLFLLDYVKNLKLPKETIVYFLEDDYLHRPDWFAILQEAFTIKEADYVTLYDHNDKYTSASYQHLNSKIFAGHHCHFRTTPSTTNTFAALYGTLMEDIAVHTAFSTGTKITKDHEKFLALQEKGRTLISSIPGFATHMESGLLSPCVDWKTISQMKKETKINPFSKFFNFSKAK
jgi:hypothetical protein